MHILKTLTAAAVLAVIASPAAHADSWKHHGYDRDDHRDHDRGRYEKVVYHAPAPVKTGYYYTYIYPYGYVKVLLPAASPAAYNHARHEYREHHRDRDDDDDNVWSLIFNIK